MCKLREQGQRANFNCIYQAFYNTTDFAALHGVTLDEVEQGQTVLLVLGVLIKYWTVRQLATVHVRVEVSDTYSCFPLVWDPSRSGRPLSPPAT